MYLAIASMRPGRKCPGYIKIIHELGVKQGGFNEAGA